ncbi:MAG: alpha/beta fold hydrolase [Desulfobulbaceae bacterium]|nr:alpha/beta fold hydrolase [Desulfobulbaceae bacterium]
MGYVGAQRGKVLVDGHNLAYVQAGSGPTVVLVHGITTYSFIWRQIMPRLANSYNVIAIDLLGCGNSDKTIEVSYSLTAHAERLKSFVDTLGIARYHLIGHDLGGGIGQIFAVNHGERLVSLSLVNTVAYDYWPVQPIIAFRTPIVRQLLMATLDMGLFRLLVERGLYHKNRLTSELMELFLAPFTTSAGRKSFLHFTKCLDNHNLMDIATRLRTLTVPTLIVRGDADPYLSVSIARKLQAEIPGSRLALKDTASHYIQEDEPEWLSSELLRFLGGLCV